MEWTAISKSDVGWKYHPMPRMQRTSMFAICYLIWKYRKMPCNFNTLDILSCTILFINLFYTSLSYFLIWKQSPKLYYSPNIDANITLPCYYLISITFSRITRFSLFVDYFRLKRENMFHKNTHRDRWFSQFLKYRIQIITFL